jgi:hypothetical protein
MFKSTSLEICDIVVQIFFYMGRSGCFLGVKNKIKLGQGIGLDE